MSNDAEQQAQRALVSSLVLTRDEELDCDAFLDHLAELVDGSLATAELRILMEHHRKICGECEEARQVLARAIAARDD